MEAALYTLLSTDASVTAVIGSGASARAYPLLLPQNGTLPAVTYQRVSTPRILTASLGGQNARVKCRMQMDCWARTFAQARTLADAVRTAMLGATTFTALALDEQSLYEPGEREDGLHFYRISTDYSCWYLE